MRFLLTNEKHVRSSLHPLLTGIILAIVLFMPLDILWHGTAFGFTPSQVMHTLYGDEENFIDPLAFDTVLLQAHTDWFSTFIVLLITEAFTIRYLSTARFTTVVVHAIGILGMLTPLLLIAAYRYALLLWVWWGMFYGWHGLIGIIGTRLLVKVWR